MATKTKEGHVTLPIEEHERLRQLSKREGRSMRQEVIRLVNDKRKELGMDK